MYRINFNNKKIELPKCTRGIIAQTIELANKSLEQAKGNYDYMQLIDDMYQFIVSIIGIDTLKEISPHTDVDDVDPKDLEILFIDIRKAYDDRVHNHSTAIMKNNMNALVGALPTKEIGNIVEMTKQVN